MHYLVLVYNGSYNSLKTFKNAELRSAFANGVLSVGEAFNSDAWAALWPEESAALKKDSPQAYKDAEAAIVEAQKGN